MRNLAQSSLFRTCGVRRRQDTAGIDAIALTLPGNLDAACAAVAALGVRAGEFALIALRGGHSAADRSGRVPGIDCWLETDPASGATRELVRLAIAAKRLGRRADEAEQWLQQVASLSSDAIVVCSDDRVRSANPASTTTKR